MTSFARSGPVWPAGHPACVARLDPAEQARLVRYIDQYSEANTSVAALAALVGMSRSSFVRAFAASFRTTPHQFVLDRRIASAGRLLSETTQSITEISAALGFSTHSHFSTVFKKRMGVTPSQFRASANC